METKTFFSFLIACFFAISLAQQTPDQTTKPNNICKKEDGPCPDGTTKSEDLPSVNPYDVIKGFLRSELSSRPTSMKQIVDVNVRLPLKYVTYVFTFFGLAYLVSRLMRCCPRCGIHPEVPESSRPNETGNQGDDQNIGSSEREPLRSLQQETDNQGGNDESIGSLSNETPILEGISIVEGSIELPSIPPSSSADHLDENPLHRYGWEETDL